jgi:hypothetical protein
MGPRVSPERRGFGSIVMEAMAERSLDGAVDLDYAPLRCDLALDLPNRKRAGARKRELNHLRSETSDEHFLVSERRSALIPARARNGS